MNPPLSRPIDLIVHIGTGKAGSSSIHAFLRENRQRLTEHGLLYPQSPGASRHVQLGLFVKSSEELERSPVWHKQKQQDPRKFRRAFRRQLFSEIEASGLSRVLLSDEVLFSRPDPALRRLRRFTDRFAESLRLVVYLRRQDDHMVSRYQQGVKTGLVNRLQEWANRDMSNLYDYHARLRTWRRLLNPAGFAVRRFEPDSFVDGSLYGDFLDAVGVGLRADDLQQVSKRNESLDAESVEFFRLLNLARVENEGIETGPIDNWRLAVRLAEVSTGPTLTLPGPALDEFMSRWEASNRAVALDCFGDDSGQLFRTPRRTRHTTTSQHLDPGRLDHFFEVAKLPEQWHGPIRRIAEREANAS